MPQHLPDFDADFAGPAQWAALYRACGLQVIPGWLPGEGRVNGSWKRPYLSQWQPLQEALVPQTQFERWYGPAGEHAGRPNMGLITGRCSGNVFVIDLDTHKNPAAAAWWNAVLEVENSGIDLETVEQRTGGGGVQKLFRAPVGFVVPTAKTSIGVDIRGQGGFAVLPPSRHDSGQSYAWLPGRSPWEIAIELAPDWLLEAVTDLAEAHGGDLSRTSKSAILTPKSPIPEGIYGESGEQVLNEFGTVIDGREHLMRDAVWHAVLELYRTSPIMPPESVWREECARAYVAYEIKVISRLAGAEKTEGLEKEGRGTTEFFRKWRRLMRLWGSPKMVAEAAKPAPVTEPAGPRASEPPPNPEGVAFSDPAKEFQMQPPPGVRLVSAFPIDKRALPVRDWLVPGLLLRRHLSVLVAPPAAGKSLMTLHLAIILGVGMAWGGWVPRRAEKILIINSEDDVEEMQRRLVAAVEDMKVDQQQLIDRVLLADAPESIVIARTDTRTKTVVRLPLIEDLIKTIREAKVSVVIVDPFAETFEGDENSNSELKWAAMLWREVARRTGTAVLIVHHTKKYAGDMAGVADASRGGGALIGTARVLSTLFTMTEDEAAALNIEPDDRTDYVRFDDAKANYSKLERARWFVKKTVSLENGDGLVPPDNVGVFVPWTPPGALEGISIHAIGIALDIIARGVTDEDGKPTGQYYAARATSTDKHRWAGKVLISALGCTEQAAKNLLKDWLKNSVLEVFEYDDPIQRKPRKGVKVITKNRPDAALQYS